MDGLTVRPAAAADAEFVAEAVVRLIGELRARPDGPAGPAPRREEYLAAAESVTSGGDPGLCLIADAGGRRLGLVTASYQKAVRTRGSYALIQELWVDPDARGRAVGGALVESLCRRAAADGCRTVEVGLPGSASPVFPATRRRYLGWGFSEVGPRLRRAIDDAAGD
jgi:GNAT superfamily N-acetyltransferase